LLTAGPFPAEAGAISDLAGMDRPQRVANLTSGKNIVRLPATVAFLVTAIALVSIAVALNPRKHNLPPGEANAITSSEPGSALPSFSPSKYDSVFAGRVLFPFSIIPGGIGSSLELQNAIDNDPVVAKHYADFNVANAHVGPLNRERSVFISYRIGNEVFWTKRMFILHKGETVVDDGNHAARARCGNRISVTPQAPVSSQEPTPEVFDRVQNHEDFYVRNAPIGSSLSLPPPNSVPMGNYFAEAENVTFYSPPILPIWWGPSSAPIVPIGLPSSYPPVVAPQPPVTVPEPNTLLLLLFGSACLLIRKIRRS
jgi:hypothetical protein